MWAARGAVGWWLLAAMLAGGCGLARLGGGAAGVDGGVEILDSGLAEGEGEGAL